MASEAEQKLYRHAFTAMGSPCELQLHAPDPSLAQRVAGRAMADVRRLEARYSRYLPDSFLSAINRIAAEGGSIDVDGETGGLLDYANTCHRESEGLFDITSGLLRRVWRRDRATLPDQAEIEALLPRIGWHKVRWRDRCLTFPPGMEIDFGGIVKEYAADRAAALCVQSGIERGVVNLGGDVRIVGAQAGELPWRIGIQHPREKQAAMGALVLHKGAVATSGDYERCLVIGGQRFGHVLNPVTGWPVRHFAAVTVIGDLCVVAGSASTIAMLKEESGAAWLARMGLPHLWVGVDGTVGGTLAGELVVQG